MHDSVELIQVDNSIQNSIIKGIYGKICRITNIFEIKIKINEKGFKHLIKLIEAKIG